MFLVGAMFAASAGTAFAQDAGAPGPMHGGGMHRLMWTADGNIVDRAELERRLDTAIENGFITEWQKERMLTMFDWRQANPDARGPGIRMGAGPGARMGHAACQSCTPRGHGRCRR